MRGVRIASVWALSGLVLAAVLTAPDHAEAGTPPTSEGAIAWAGDVGPPDPFSRQILVMNADGSAVTQLTNDSIGATDPAWSPEGTRIAFSSFRNGLSYDIYVMDADGSNVTLLVGGPHNDVTPTWSPDGSKIAYGTRVPGTDGVFSLQIFVVDIGGGVPVSLTAPSLQAEGPAWSPDGSKIAFTGVSGDVGRDPEIFVMDADGSNAMRLTNSPYTDRRPAWSPDGTQIAFESYRAARLSEVFVMDADGGNQVRLTDNRFFNEYPTWSPDGSKIAFAVDRADGTTTGFDISVMDVDGTNQTQITNRVGVDFRPDWQQFGHPVARPDGPYLVERGGTIAVPAAGVLANDFDGGGDPLSASVVTPPSSGSALLDAAGSFAYTHGGGADIADTFTYAASDGPLDSMPATVMLIVVEPGSTPETVGLVDPRRGVWHLLAGSGQVTSFVYGNPGDHPIAGDWDCDGIDTPGLYRRSDGFVYLRNSNTQGVADVEFFFGNPDDIPVAGDFDGDGCDTVSLYRPSEGKFYVIDRLGSGTAGLGAADLAYYFGNPGDTPSGGDVDGDGIDEILLHRASTGLVYFRLTHTQGVADLDMVFGDPGDRLVAGDWTGDGLDTAGVFRPGDKRFYLRNSNTQGIADITFPLGMSSWMPVVGVFGLG